MKKLLTILLSLCCLFLIGCGKNHFIDLGNHQITPNRYTYKETDSETEYYVWKITISFIPNYNIENLILEVPIYTYEEGDGLFEAKKFNKFELYKAEIEVGTVYKDEIYKVEHKISAKDYKILENHHIKIEYGEISVKGGKII